MKKLLFILFLLFPACQTVIDKTAQEQFVHSSEKTISVLPVHIILGQQQISDPMLQHELVDWLNLQDGLVANSYDNDAIIGVPWGRNQLKMFNNSAKAFAAWAQTSGVKDTHYLLVEFLSNESETWIGGIHYYVVDRFGNVLDGGLANSHGETFQAIDSHDRVGALKVVILMLTESWIVPN